MGATVTEVEKREQSATFWRSRHAGKLVADIVTYLRVGISLLVVGLPIIWMVLTAFKAPEELFILPPRWLPSSLNWSNFVKAWHSLPMARFYLNTFIVAFSVMVLQLLNGALCAYVLVRLRLRGKNVIFIAFLAAMMIPTQVTIIPAYVILAKLGWINTYAALIVPNMASVFAIFLLRQAFYGVPSDLIDAAMMDGAGHLRLLFQIMLPLVKPVLVTLGVLTFTWQWNEYFWPLIMTNTMNMRTLPVGLVFLSAVEDIYSNWSALMAGTLLVLIPIIILFLIAQKQFVLSVTRSGMHGM
jgi:sn-glycerol 3-phosphate transport system permease protein